MDFKENFNRPKNPKELSNFFSKLTFYYMITIIRETIRDSFGEKQIYEPPSDIKSQSLGKQFEKLWAQKSFHKKGKHHKIGIVGLFIIIAKMFWKKFIFYYIFVLISKIILTIYQPLIFGKIVGHFRYPNPNIYFLGIALVAINFLSSFIFLHFTQASSEISLQIAVALSSAIYRKTIKLKLEVTENLESKVGNVVTLITKDVFAFGFTIYFISNILIFAIITTIQMVVIYEQVGWIGLITVVMSLAIVLLETFFAYLSQPQRYKECIYAAKRINVLKEAFSLIRLVKMSLLENFYIQKCNEYRKKEIFHLLNVCILRMINLLMGNLGCSTAFIITILIYSLVKGDFSAQKLFYLSSSLEVIRSFFNFIFPYGLSKSAESIASLKRLDQYFLLSNDYLSESYMSDNQFNKTADTAIVKAKNLKIELSGRTAIHKVNFEIFQRGLLVITGPIGSGKTMLLKAIIGEVQTRLDNLVVQGSLSYAPQDPWLFPGTIRQNILFGQEYNENRYCEVVERCALTYDFNRFENNDETLVIDDGINLSKGQKMRINLARAIYQNKQIYILDSVLNFIDMQTNKYIFQKVMKEFLNDKICILVSDNPLHSQKADQVFCLASTIPSSLILNKEIKTELYYSENFKLNKTKSNEFTQSDFNELSNLLNNNNDNLNNDDDYNIQFIYKEQNKKGNVTLSTYKTYIKFCGGVWVVLYLIIIFMLSEIVLITSQKFMSIWINAEEKLFTIKKNITSYEKSLNYKTVLSKRDESFHIYIIGFVLNVILHSTASLSTLYICTSAAKKIQKAMVKSVIYSEMEFFCTTLLGTILNRFSKDINNIDEMLPNLIYSSFWIIFNLLGLFVMIALSQWIFSIPIAIIIILALAILKLILLPVTTKSKRLEAALHSPLVGYLNCTLNGLSTIRVMGPNKEKLIQEFDYHQDLFASAFYISFSTEQILKIVLQIGCNILLAIVVFYFVSIGKSNPGDVGLGLGKTLVIIRIIDFTLIQYMNLEAQLTSLERVCDYLKLKQENQSGVSLSDDWQPNGKIIIQNLNLTYKSTNQHVLKNVNLSIEDGEKIAIIGRTGSGKSSLISCLFRMYEYSGNIIINGVDIKGLELNYLRSQFGVISQDKLIFSGSLRDSIDPLKKHTDSEILFIIANISKFLNLSAHKQRNSILQNIMKLDIDLNKQINRELLSSGEKQIINILRVILSQKRIIILDELVEDLDDETNMAIEGIIEEYFKKCTIIYVFHKYVHLQKMDKICVIQDGEVVEFAKPSHLLNDHKSIFRKMIDN